MQYLKFKYRNFCTLNNVIYLWFGLSFPFFLILFNVVSLNCENSICLSVKNWSNDTILLHNIIELGFFGENFQ